MTDIEKINELLKGSKVVKVDESGSIKFDNGYELVISGGDLDTTYVGLFDLKENKNVVEYRYYF